MSRIPVGISACLLGQAVRYDGGHKHSRYCTEVLARHFDFHPVCPELEAGFGVPRPPIHLREVGANIRLIQSKGDKDFSAPMQDFIHSVLPGLSHLRGYILMAKSPSCGLERIKIHDHNGRVIRHDGRGLFAGALKHAYPLMPVAEESQLNDDQSKECFIKRVFAYDDRMRGITSARTLKSLD